MAVGWTDDETDEVALSTRLARAERDEECVVLGLLVTEKVLSVLLLAEGERVSRPVSEGLGVSEGDCDAFALRDGVPLRVP